MIEVTGLYRYPLTGASAESMEQAPLTATGITGDRQLVLYDDAVNENGSYPRVSQKTLPALARVKARVVGAGTEIIMPDYGNFYASHDQVAEDTISIDEFGEATPAQDMGDLHARRFSSLFGREGLRLAFKTQEWLAGGIVTPSKRIVSPLHLISEATVRELRSRLPEAQFEADRFRGSITFDGDVEPMVENDWCGQSVCIGDTEFVVDRPTMRCRVPGIDQRTGDNRKDVPKIYPGLPKSDSGKPLVGVYAYPVLEAGEKGVISVGMAIDL